MFLDQTLHLAGAKYLVMLDGDSVAPNIVLDVSCERDQSSSAPFFVAGAIFREVAVPHFVARAIFGAVGVSLFVAGAPSRQNVGDSRSEKSFSVARVGKVSSANGLVRDDGFMLCRSSDHARIMVDHARTVLHGRKQVADFLINLELRISWQAQYLVMWEGNSCFSAQLEVSCVTSIKT